MDIKILALLFGVYFLRKRDQNKQEKASSIGTLPPLDIMKIPEKVQEPPKAPPPPKKKTGCAVCDVA